MMKANDFFRQIVCPLVILCGVIVGVPACSREEIKKEDSLTPNQESVFDTNEKETYYMSDGTDTGEKMETVTATEQETEIESETVLTKDPNQVEWDPQN